MKYALIAVVVLLSWGQPAVAFDFSTAGVGNDSCGTWTKESRQGGAIHWQNEQWVAGYVTASSVQLRRDLISGTDFDGLMGWIDKYCRNNPTSSLMNASWWLVDFLKKR